MQSDAAFVRPAPASAALRPERAEAQYKVTSVSKSNEERKQSAAAAWNKSSARPSICSPAAGNKGGNGVC